MEQYEDGYDAFVSETMEKYRNLAHIAHCEIEALGEILEAPRPFALRDLGIAFTGAYGKQIHPPTLAVVLSEVASRRLLEDLLFAWTEFEREGRLVVCFPGVTYDRFGEVEA